MHSLLAFFLASENGSSIPGWIWGVLVAVALVCAAGGAAAGFYIYRSYRNKKEGTAQAQADSILEFAREEAKSLKREAINEAKEEVQRLKTENERQCRERTSELQKQENRLHQKVSAILRRLFSCFC